MKQIINRKVYDTETANLLAHDRYWDGSNFERSGRNCYLYSTPNGAYFEHYTTQWQGERDSIRALTLEEALERYEQLPEQVTDFTEAFPGVPLEDA
jgi:hypothetical protein